MAQRSYLQIMFKEIGTDDNFEVYSESIKSIHQYGGCDFYVKKCVPTNKIMVSFIQYPEINLNYPVSTNEWLSNQWLFRKSDDTYIQCGDVYNEDGNYFLFDTQNNSDSDNYDSAFSELYLAAVFNLAGHYAIEFTELDSNNNAVDRVVVYVECVDIKTLNITLPFNTESTEFAGWNKSINRSIYSLAQQIGNNFRMIYVDKSESSDSDTKTYNVGDVVTTSNESDTYNGFMDTFFTINKDENEDASFGVIVENPIDCYFVDNSSDGTLKAVTVYKVAYTGIYRTTLPNFAISSKVYLNMTDKILSPDKDSGSYVGEYDADNNILLLEKTLNTEANPEVYNYYPEFIADDKFSVSEGDCLKFTELYNNDSINIEESGLNQFVLNNGDVIAVNSTVISTYVVDDLNPFRYVIDDEIGITYYVTIDDEGEEHNYAPYELSLVKWSRKGAVCGEMYSSVENTYSEIFNERKIFSNENNSMNNWIVLLKKSERPTTLETNATTVNYGDVFEYKKYNTLNVSEESITFFKESRLFNPLSYDYYGIDDKVGIIAIAEHYKTDRNDEAYLITISTNKDCINENEEFANIKTIRIVISCNLGDDIISNFSEYFNCSLIDDFKDIGGVNNIRNLKIIKHENFYALYFVVDYDNEVSKIGCITFYANYGKLLKAYQREEDSFGVIFNTSVNYFDDADSFGKIKEFKVSPINNGNDIIVASKEVESGDDSVIKIFVSSELNRFGEMSIQYAESQSGSNIESLPTSIDDFDICKVSENICVFATKESIVESDENKPLYNIRLITYESNEDEITAFNGDKPYTIKLSENGWQSPVMKNYAADGNNNCLAVIPVGKDSFVIQYGAGNYVRMAIGTVNQRIEDEVKSIDLFWQEIKNHIIKVEGDLNYSMLCKSKLRNGDEIITSFNVMDEEDIIRSIRINTVSVNDIMGIASVNEDSLGKRKICYYGECKIDNRDRFVTAGTNVYADDFGNLCKTPTDNFLGQYIGNDMVIKK